MSPPQSQELEARGPEGALLRLQRLTRLLQQYGLICVLFTVGNLALLVVAALMSPSRTTSPEYGYSSSRYSPFEALPSFAGLGAFMAILMLIMFEIRRKRGHDLFDELSDEFQWNLLNPERKASDGERGKPPIDVRLILREFSRASDLPLVPGKFGPIAYVFINILIVIGLIIRH